MWPICIVLDMNDSSGYSMSNIINNEEEEEESNPIIFSYGSVREQFRLH